MGWELAKLLFEHGMERGRRSTVLTTILTVAGMLTTALVVAGVEQAPEWIDVFLATLTAFDFALFVWAYVHFAKLDPDTLRTERYLTHKLAIESGLLGDKLTGEIEADIAISLPKMSEEQPKQIESSL